MIFAREAAKELNAEDNEGSDKDIDAAKDGQTSMTTEVLKQFC